MSRICRCCGDDFILTPNKPGNINDCTRCAKEPYKKIMALVSHTGSAASDIQLVLTQNQTKANRFNDAQKHHWSKAF